MADPQGPPPPSKISFGPVSTIEFDKDKPTSSVNPGKEKRPLKRKRGRLPIGDIPSGDIPKGGPGPKREIARRGARKRKREPNPSGDNQCLPPNHKIARGRARPKQLKGMTDEEKEAEFLARLEKNREAARLCRRNKKAQVEVLKGKVVSLGARDAKQKETIKELNSTIVRLQAKLAICSNAGSGLSEERRCDLDSVLRNEIEDWNAHFHRNADLQGAFCGADSTGASGYSPIEFLPDPTAATVTDKLQELGDLSDILPHADELVEGPECDPRLAQVSMTLRQVNGKLAEMGFITDTVPRSYDPGYITSVVQKVRRDPVLAHPPWAWWNRGKKSGSTTTRERPSHVEPTVVLPEGTKY